MKTYSVKKRWNNSALNVKERPLENIYAQCMELLDYSFPKEELFPGWALRLWAACKGNQWLAYYDENTFVGSSFCFSTEDTVFLLYLAVVETCRCGGYESKIINSIKKQYKDKDIVLCTEPCNQEVENFRQRCRRLAFYKRNGFVETGYFLKNHDDPYDILAYSYGEFSPRKGHKAVARMAFGIAAPKFEAY